MSYHHLTITERIKAETYLKLSLKPCQVARKLVPSISLYNFKRIEALSGLLFGILGSRIL